jgi:hypothetical protein
MPCQCEILWAPLFYVTYVKTSLPRIATLALACRASESYPVAGHASESYPVAGHASESYPVAGHARQSYPVAGRATL